MCEFCDNINREIIESKSIVRIQIEIPENFMNIGVTLDNHFIADTNDTAGWDTLKFPLPDGNWSIYKTEGKIVTLQTLKGLVPDKNVVAPESKFSRHGFSSTKYHDVNKFYPDDIIIDKPMIEEMITAMNDWLHQYASELCDDDSVRETYKRINESGGTLAYIAKVVDNLKKLIN